MHIADTAAQARAVAEALRTAGLVDVDAGNRRRAEYSSDASLYRVVPQVVAFPRDADDVLAAVAVARERNLPITPRGAGTSVAGNAIGPGLVLDMRRHMGALIELDPYARRARVQPGVVLDQLQVAAAASGLRFGPDPSTHDRCTLGGMIGNNACGARSVAYGTTADNVHDLTIVDGTGWYGQLSAHPAPGLTDLIKTHGDTIAAHLGHFRRQLSGYGLAGLLDDPTAGLINAFVGSEGTCGIVTEATVGLVEDPPIRVLIVFGYPDMAAAADASPAIVRHHPTAVEGLDQRIVAIARTHDQNMPELPTGAGLLFVELAGQSLGELQAQASRIIADADAVDSRLVTDPAEAAALWRMREAGAGFAARGGSRPAHPGWEDAAVPPERLGEYLRDFDALLSDYELHGAPYGHFGDGCVHIRIDLPFDRRDGIAVFRRFLTDATRLVARYGGSTTGEHGDGRARSELLALRYPRAVLDAFTAFARIFDPDDCLNPGVIVDPVPLDANLRPARTTVAPVSAGPSVIDPADSLTSAVHRCIGVGACVSELATASGRVMCPSYAATRDERDSTRGRARVLQEAITGGFTSDPSGLAAPEVRDALDLCLGCKACAHDCPTQVDMAAYRSEVLATVYRRRLRPRNHYTLGRLPRWLRFAAPFSALINAALRVPGVPALGKWVADIDPARNLPLLARHRLRRRRDHGLVADVHTGSSTLSPRALLWVDTLNEYLTPEVARAAEQVLEQAGYRVAFVPAGRCCGLPMISTGQLVAAKRSASHLVDLLDDHASADLIVGLEPSCVAALRSDVPRLLRSEAALRVAARTRTLAEALAARRATWSPPDLSGRTLVTQIHCHQHAHGGFGPERALLGAAGARVVEATGCCGLAGDFGMKRGRFAFSRDVAATALLPTLAAYPDADVLADGASCRTQILDLSGRRAMHLAQLLRRA